MIAIRTHKENAPFLGALWIESHFGRRLCLSEAINAAMAETK